MGRWHVRGWVGAGVMWAFVALGGGPAEAAKWSRATIDALPDEAFAAVEVMPDGTRARHLPHHDAEGRLDLPHLRSALSRWHQVRWLDPADAGPARQHLLEHLRTLGLPTPGPGRGRHGLSPRPQLSVPGASLVAGAVHPRASRQPAPLQLPAGLPSAKAPRR